MSGAVKRVEYAWINRAKVRNIPPSNNLFYYHLRVIVSLVSPLNVYNNALDSDAPDRDFLYLL